MSQVATHAVEPAETPLTPESWGKLGMWIFLAGDAVGFGVLLAGYGVMRSTSADWPNPFDVLGINLTALMTFLLICSSVTMVKALEWLGKGDRRRAINYLLYTALGGTIFVSLQAYEWTHLIHRGLHINGNPFGAALFGTSFFLVTGFHGLHVTAGVIYLPGAQLQLSGSGNVGAIQIIADTVDISGSSDLTIDFQEYVDIPVPGGMRLIE